MIGESEIWSKCTKSLEYGDEMLPIVTDRSRVKVDFLSLGSSFGTNESDPTVFGDAYSGSWWTSVSNFLRYKKVENKWGSQEGASFDLFGANRDKVRMTKDWLDFSAEH